MKKNNVSKKFYSILMASAIISQPIATAYAAVGEAETSTMESGVLDLSMNLDLPVKKASFSISLENGEKTKTGTMQANDAGTMALLSMKDITPGIYILRISGEGFAAYTQEVEITANTTTVVELHNSHRVNAALAEGSVVKHGVMAVGDVNHDGTVNEADAKVLMDAIDAGKTDELYDLNGDGAVDVADLAYVTMNYGDNVQATALSVVSAESIKPNSKSFTKGNIQDLTEKTETFVQFQPENKEEISTANPVELSLEIDTQGDKRAPEIDGIVIKAPANSENLIRGGTIDIETEKGTIQAIITKDEQVQESPVFLSRFPMPYAARAAATARIESDGSIVVDLGQQVAVKKVTITVTESSGSNLVDIAQVEFVNGMENRIPAPELNIPENIELTQLSAGMDPAFRVSWKHQVNVTGYEVEVQADGKSTVVFTTDNNCRIGSLGGKLHTGTEYAVRVRSVNGDWKSPYSDKQTITLTPDSVPSAPENITVTGNVESIDVSWKRMSHTTSYSVFYKEQDAQTDYTEIRDIKTNSYTITDLKVGVAYQVYVVGHNTLGSSPKSTINVATPVPSTLVEMRKYGLINTSNGTGKPTAHIKSVAFTNNTINHGGEFSVVDNDPSTYTQVQDWETGYHYGNFANPMVTLDQEYAVQAIGFAVHDSQKNSLKTDKAAVRYYDKKTGNMEVVKSYLQPQKDANGKTYYIVGLNEPIVSDQFQLCLVANGNVRNITISEMKFYRTDELARDIDALYMDDLHLELREGVTEKTIGELQVRLDTVDPESQEYHPNREGLQKELENAKSLLEQKDLGAAITVNTKISSKADGHLDFGGLSNYQPLGKVAKAGETVTIYVGGSGKANGEKTDLKLVATQHHAEASAWSNELPLVVGRNTIEIPNITTRKGENGGSLYLAWNGDSNTAQKYSVRVQGGTDIPVLDVTGQTGEERRATINAYMKKLESYVAALSSTHDTAEHGTGSYSERDCIFNHTEIVMQNMMYSVPASVVLSATNGDAGKMEQAIEAMEQEIDLFYQHKGLDKNGTGVHHYPAQRLNIRYHKMFEGAFMYAGGKHIGIEFDSVGGLFGITPIKADEKGTRQSGQLTGWGIAHEIGHIINNGQYAVAEITNNYYSILATNNPRSDYKKVHQAVTGGKMEDSGLQMSMYWQLHMAYDPYDTFKLFDNYEEQMKNLFFARVDAYSRDPKSAPHDLSLTDSKEDKLIRLACAAANKNLLEFFDAWGLSYNSETAQYAKKFEKETRKIQYLTPEANAYKIADGEGMGSGVNVDDSKLVNKDGENTVHLTLSNNANLDDMLGYEILRDGKPVAFVDADKTEYVDTITTGNNRTYTYTVIGYDKLLNQTREKTFAPIKVRHNGAIDRSKWNISTNMKSEDDEEIKPGENNGYCHAETISAISGIIDGKGYTGSTEKGKNAEIVLDLGSVEQVTAIKYKGEAADFTVSVSKGGGSWTSAGTFTSRGGTETFYFEAKKKLGFMHIFDADKIKIEFKSNAATIQDIQILGPTSDNVELGEVGYLKETIKYGQMDADIIPKGSLVFTGDYKGNPAYNVVLLKDQDGKIISGEQIILAPVPEHGELGKVSDGTWVYWITPENKPETLPTKVMAELYRVDDAQSNTGDRLVSNTLYLNMPQTIPEIKLEGNIVPDKETPIDPDLIIPKSQGDRDAETEKTEVPPAEALEDDQPEDSEDTQPNDAAAARVHTDTKIAVDAGEMSETLCAMRPAGVQRASVGTAAPQAVALTGTAVQAVTVEADQNGEAKFTFRPNTAGTKATMQLDLGQGVETLAFQTAFQVSDGVSGVQMQWSDAIKNRALLKECRYNADTKTVTIYVTAARNLLEDGTFDLGEIALTTSTGVTTASLALEPSKTMTMNEKFESEKVNTPSVTVTLTTSTEAEKPQPEPEKPENGGSSGGNSSGSSSGSKPSKKPSKKPESKPEQTVPQSDTSTSVQAVSAFTDVAKGSWYYDAVAKAIENGWFNGTSETTFAPNSTMTRAMFVTVLGRFAVMPEVEAANTFLDVPTDSYFAKAVAWASAKGIVNGTSANAFAPNQQVTREQMAVMIHKFLKANEMDLPQEGNTAKGFADDDAISDWAKEAVQTMQKMGVIQGLPDGRFNPQGSATRAEVATIFRNLENKIPK